MRGGEGEGWGVGGFTEKQPISPNKFRKTGWAGQGVTGHFARNPYEVKMNNKNESEIATTLEMCLLRQRLPSKVFSHWRDFAFAFFEVVAFFAFVPIRGAFYCFRAVWCLVQDDHQ